ncbi:hypothetical protein FY133_00545 [Agrobacterium tumefaciens]|uniref:hypothetical protein n=1 Tax=Agrobacterium tumefaciens TaxID=358 RepID=UPI0021D2C034|nr:hypothetical protein [Agrobacterium tumefaciens]UXT64140.1 hypothetical protein FY133_00545 [Agrobacterium tumefaciens]
MKTISQAIAILAISTSAAVAAENSCGEKYWQGTGPEHAVDQISVSGIQSFLDTSSAVDGIKFDVTIKGKEVWLDIVQYPPQVSVIASLRSLLVLGRVVKPGYDKLVLADGNKGLFQVSYHDIHAIGCQFVWGTEGGQNPIHLLRELADSLTYYADGSRVAPPFTGSLMGDTSAMLGTMNKIVYPEWLLKTVTIQ